MDPSQQPPSTTISTSSSKVRLMLSYGGQIHPRPNFNSLFYHGGDTRIVAVDRRVTTNISAFISHISSSLKINYPFVVKYQLPNHDLDSLISVTNDDDLFIMFDEHDRLVGSNSSRLRLFLFPLKQQQQKHHQFVTAVTNLPNSPPDSWFSDTIKSAKLMRRKDGAAAACLEDKSLGSLQESVVLETSSSFGSTSSSGSSTNAPSAGVRVEDSVLKLAQPDPVLSYNDPASGISHTKIGIIQDPIVDSATIISGRASPRDELQSNTSSAYSPQVYTPVPFSGYPMSAQPHQPLPPAQLQQQQHQMQFVQRNSQYNYYPMGPSSICSNSPMYSQLPPYQTHYRPSQAYPIYLVPISQTQPYVSSVQSNMIDTGITTTTAPTTTSQPLMCTNVAMAPPQMSLKEASAAQPAVEYASNAYKVNHGEPQMSHKETAAAQPAVEYASYAYKVNPVAIPVNVTSTQNQQQLAGIQPLLNPPHSVAIPSVEATNKFSNADEDSAHNLIYKTQPSAPTMPSQYQTMTGATTLLLPEDLTKLHVSEAAQQLIV